MGEVESPLESQLVGPLEVRDSSRTLGRTSDSVLTSGCHILGRISTFAKLMIGYRIFGFVVIRTPMLGGDHRGGEAMPEECQGVRSDDIMQGSTVFCSGRNN